MPSRPSLLTVLVVALCVLRWPCVAQEAENKATAYQQRLHTLDEQAQRLAKKRYFEARGGPKLTTDEGAEWLAVTGELHEINPYWRFHRQLVEDIAAMTEAKDADPELWGRSQSRFSEFLKIVDAMHPAATQDEAQAEVFRLRAAFIAGDLHAAHRLATQNATHSR